MATPSPQPTQALTLNNVIKEAFSPIAAVNDGYKVEQLPPAPAGQNISNIDGVELTPSQYQVSILFIYST